MKQKKVFFVVVGGSVIGVMLVLFLAFGIGENAMYQRERIMENPDNREGFVDMSENGENDQEHRKSSEFQDIDLTMDATIDPSQVVSEDTSLEALEMELDQTNILEEDLSDL